MLRLWNNKAGNIAIITALMMIPLTFALGMAYDYTMASNRKDQIDGMADSAALGRLASAKIDTLCGNSRLVRHKGRLAQGSTRPPEEPTRPPDGSTRPPDGSTHPTEGSTHPPDASTRPPEEPDRKSTRLNSSHSRRSRMPSSA